MPVDPATLKAAIWTYAVASKWLLWLGLLTAVAACATVAAAFKQWQANNIIEAHNDWRTATLEKETAQAKLDFAQAQERMAELGKEAEALKAQSSEAEKDVALLKNETAQANQRAAEANKLAEEARLELERLKTPRTLNAEQQARIVDRVKTFAGTPYNFVVMAETEPMNLMVHIDAALETAGWKLVSWESDNPLIIKRDGKPKAGVSVTEGLGIEIAESKRAEWEDPAEALANALAAEGLIPKLNSSTLPDVKSDAIHIVIGEKK
jgi:chromosome segregation ATPase